MRARWRKRRGAALIEAGLVLPIILLFLFGIFEYGRYLMTLENYNNAAREGVRYALANTQPVTISGTTSANSDSAVQNKVQGYLTSAQLSSQNVQVYKSDIYGNNTGTWQSAKFGELICVRITGSYQPVGPAMLFLPSSIPVTINSIMRSEAN